MKLLSKRELYIVQHFPSCHYDYSSCESVDAAVETIVACDSGGLCCLWCDEEDEYDSDYKDECGERELEARSTLKVYTPSEVLAAARSGASWPGKLGLIR